MSIVPEIQKLARSGNISRSVAQYLAEAAPDLERLVTKVTRAGERLNGEEQKHLEQIYNGYLRAAVRDRIAAKNLSVADKIKLNAEIRDDFFNKIVGGVLKTDEDRIVVRAALLRGPRGEGIRIADGRIISHDTYKALQMSSNIGGISETDKILLKAIQDAEARIDGVAKAKATAQHHSDTATLKAKADAGAASKAAAEEKARAAAAATEKAEANRLRAEQQAGARAAIIGDINSILAENVPNPEQLKGKFSEMRRILGEQGLLDSSPRFTPSTMNPDDLARALAEGHPIHVDDISNVERHLVDHIGQISGEAKRASLEETDNLAKAARARALPENISVLHAVATAKKRVEIENLSEKLGDMKQHLLDEGKMSSHTPYAGRSSTPNEVLQKIIGGDNITVGEWTLLETHMKTWHSKINPQEISQPSQSPQGFMGQMSGKNAFFQGAKDFLAEKRQEKNAEAHLEAFFGKKEYDKTRGFFSRHALATAGAVALSLGLAVWNGLDSENDDFDNGLSPMQRIAYNFQKARMSLTPTGTVFGVKFGDDLANDVLSNTSNDPVKLALKSSVQATHNVVIDKVKDQGEKVVGQTQASAMSAPPPVITHIFPQYAAGVEEKRSVNIPQTLTEMQENFDINEEEASKLKKAWASATQKPDPSQAFKEQAKTILSGRSPENVGYLVQKLGL